MSLLMRKLEGDGLTRECQREIEELHQLFVAWFQGSKPSSVLQNEFQQRLQPRFSHVAPNGQFLSGRHVLLGHLHDKYGCYKDRIFRIDIYNVQLLWSADGTKCLCTYEEWQSWKQEDGENNETGDDDGEDPSETTNSERSNGTSGLLQFGRLSTCLLERVRYDDDEDETNDNEEPSAASESQNNDGDVDDGVGISPGGQHRWTWVHVHETWLEADKPPVTAGRPSFPPVSERDEDTVLTGPIEAHQMLRNRSAPPSSSSSKESSPPKSPVLATTTTTTPPAATGPRLIVLVGLQGGAVGREASQHQSLALVIARTEGVPHEIVDGSDFAQRHRREELWDLSGSRGAGSYPQFFVVTDELDETVTYWGDWERFRVSHDAGTLREDLGLASTAPSSSTPSAATTTTPNEGAGAVVPVAAVSLGGGVVAAAESAPTNSAPNAPSATGTDGDQSADDSDDDDDDDEDEDDGDEEEAGEDAQAAALMAAMGTRNSPPAPAAGATPKAAAPAQEDAAAAGMMALMAARGGAPTTKDSAPAPAPAAAAAAPKAEAAPDDAEAAGLMAMMAARRAPAKAPAPAPAPVEVANRNDNPDAEAAGMMAMMAARGGAPPKAAPVKEPTQAPDKSDDPDAEAANLMALMAASRGGGAARGSAAPPPPDGSAKQPSENVQRSRAIGKEPEGSVPPGKANHSVAPDWSMDSAAKRSLPTPFDDLANNSSADVADPILGASVTSASMEPGAGDEEEEPSEAAPEPPNADEGKDDESSDGSANSSSNSNSNSDSDDESDEDGESNGHFPVSLQANGDPPLDGLLMEPDDDDSEIEAARVVAANALPMSSDDAEQAFLHASKGILVFEEEDEDDDVALGDDQQELPEVIEEELPLDTVSPIPQDVSPKRHVSPKLTKYAKPLMWENALVGLQISGFDIGSSQGPIGDETWYSETGAALEELAQSRSIPRPRRKICLPEMVFPTAHVALEGHGYWISWDAIDALEEWAKCHHEIAIHSKIAHRGVSVLRAKDAALWESRRKHGQDQSGGSSVFHYDWTFSTPFCGKVEGGKWQDLDESGMRMSLLTDQSVPILFFDEVVLFEDDLHDNGQVSLAVKIRVMPSCAYVLARLYCRVDEVVVRCRETRVLIDFFGMKPQVYRDVSWRECAWEQLKELGLPTEVRSWRFDVETAAFNEQLKRLPEVPLPKSVPKHAVLVSDQVGLNLQAEFEAAGPEEG